MRTVGWLGAIATVVGAIAFPLLGIHNGTTTPGTALEDGLWWFAWTPLGVVGGFLVARRPELLTSWLLMVAGLVTVAGAALGEFASGGHLGTLPRVLLLEWGVHAWYPVGLLALGLLVIHFPEGPGAGPWRWVVRAAWVTGGLQVLAYAAMEGTQQGGFDAGPQLENPWALVPVSNVAVTQNLGGLTGLIMVLAIVRLAWRSRRAPLLERQQIKLFLFSVSAMIVLAVVGSSIGERYTALDAYTGDLAIPVGVTGIAVAVAVSVTRYRLYEVDRLVSRTVGYLVVTAVLAGVYAVGVLGVGALVQSGSSDLVVAGSTLAVAALFQPVRHRVQEVVDRRFNRARYDAQAAAAGFGAHLRDEVNLSEVVFELGRAVDGSLRPATVSVWVRPNAVGTSL